MRSASMFLVVAAVFVFTAHAQAAIHPSGGEFLSFCNATTGDADGDVRFEQCERFVEETRRALSSNAVHGKTACIPNDVGNLRLIFLAINWIEDNPNSVGEEADEVLAQAFSKAFPCRIRNKTR